MTEKELKELERKVVEKFKVSRSSQGLEYIDLRLQTSLWDSDPVSGGITRILRSMDESEETLVLHRLQAEHLAEQLLKTAKESR